LSFPEPLCTTELDIFRINGRDSVQSRQETSSRNTVLNTKGNVGDPLLHSINGVCKRQGLKIMRIILTVVDKMPIATLQGETIGQVVKAVNEFYYSAINLAVSETSKTFLL
jgi:hypothetical protein